MNDGRTKYEHFDGLIERNNALIERMCILRASGDGRRCDELRQECYIMIWKHEKQIGTDISPRQEALWVYWTCRSAFSRLRLLRRAHLYVALDDTLADTLAAHDGTDPLGDYIETLSAILTPHERRAVELMVQGHTPDEMALELGIKPHSAVQLRHRVIAKLRKRFNPENNNHKEQ